jgi:DNA polymerase-1
VDNIPGVSGVGKKTAVTLLKKYDCIDGIYENVDDVGKDRVLTHACASATHQSRFRGDT